MAIYFFRSLVDPCVWYKEEMVLLFYIDECLMLSPSKDKIYEVYASIRAYLKIEDDIEIKKYLGIDLDLHPDGSIHLIKPHLTQRITNMIPGMER